ncbi:10 kDa heat shock protein [Chytridiales sp. JEL 0842]|nr:10 kDa heat shock protein [Chytridiales sp. JEL 0842]
MHSPLLPTFEQHQSAVKKILPLFDRVLVQRVKAVERTASGLFIPEKAQEALNEGVVIAVGPGAVGKDGKLHPVSVKAGEHVLLPQFGGNQVKVGGEEYILFQDSDILAKITKE